MSKPMIVMPSGDNELAFVNKRLKKQFGNDKIRLIRRSDISLPIALRFDDDTVSNEVIATAKQIVRDAYAEFNSKINIAWGKIEVAGDNNAKK